MANDKKREEIRAQGKLGDNNKTKQLEYINYQPA